MAGLNQGIKLKEKMKNKIIQAFSSKDTEGFAGILGSNPQMDNVIKRDNAQTEAKTTNFNNNIAQYGTDYDALKQKTDLYLDDTENDYALKKNYNVFINKRETQMQVSGEKQKGCVTSGSISSLQIARGFAKAYPNNFSNYADAETACKLWAVDTGSAVYGLNQNDTGQFQCRIGQGYTDLTQYTKPSTLYTLVTGNNRARAGGLFGNGQIGTWTGQTDDRRLPPMTPVTLVVKYNSDSYYSWSWSRRRQNQSAWGPPTPPGERYTGWGYNYFPNNRDAWWISTNELYYVGTMGYFYYEYDSPSDRQIWIYMVVDDSGVLKVNGKVITEHNSNQGTGGHVYFNVDIVKGINIFSFELVNTGGPGAFVLYAVDFPVGDTTKPVLFTSGPGWVYSKINNQDDVADTYRVKALNLVPTGFEKCNRLIGGGVNKNSIVANYGRNCSYDTQPPGNIRYINVSSNPDGECIQIAQLAVISDGVNVAPRGKVSYADRTWQGETRPSTAIDGTLAPRAYPNIYHSVCNKGQQWVLDLGKGYPVSRIIYYNRSDCCSNRANGMKIYLYHVDGRTVLKTLTLSGALVQEFGV